MKSFLAAAAALSLGSTVYALDQQCVSSDLCYSLSIPESTASSNNGDIYFQISASTSYSWAALGQGGSMIGANIFVIYTSADGKNVTVSPRIASSYSDPVHDTAAHITVLEGSGVSGGKMIANVRCSNCQSWNGGSGTMDFTQSSADFIYAAYSGSPLNSDSLTESLSQHTINSKFTWTISSAKGGSETVNPFVASSGSGGGGSHRKGGSGGSGTVSSSIPSTCTPIADTAGSGTAQPTSDSPSSTLAGPSGAGCPTTWPASFSTAWPTQSPPAWVTACYPNGPTGRGFHQARATDPPFVAVKKVKRDDGCPAGYASSGSSIGSISDDGLGLSASQQQKMVLAHGVLAALAFVALFPVGGILIRVASFTGLIWVHAALQMVAYLIYIVAFGMGVYLATHLGYMGKTHPILGVVLLIILFFQPIFGILHHRLYKKYGHRTFWSYAHLFHGRIAILLGIVNGGLGIQLANTASTGARAAYAVVAAIMAVAYIGAAIFGEVRRKRRGPPTYEKSQKAHQLRDLSSSESDEPYLRQQAGSEQHLPPPPPPPSHDFYGGKENRF